MTDAAVLDTIRTQHVRAFGDSMEPDPERPGYMRRTTWCAGHESPVSWPCQTRIVLGALDDETNKHDRCDRDWQRQLDEARQR